jgi:hypothetical protein
MSSMPTKRTVLFISDGFNRFAGQELTAILRAYYVGDPSLTFNARDLQPRVNELLKLAVRDNVRFYTLDSRGVYTSSSVPAPVRTPAVAVCQGPLHAPSRLSHGKTPMLSQSWPKKQAGPSLRTATISCVEYGELSPMAAKHMFLPMFLTRRRMTENSGASQ